MYSKALAILDANTVEYMVEQQRKEILELKEALKDKDKALKAQQKELEQLKALMQTGQTFRSDS